MDQDDSGALELEELKESYENNIHFRETYVSIEGDSYCGKVCVNISVGVICKGQILSTLMPQ